MFAFSLSRSVIQEIILDTYACPVAAIGFSATTSNPEKSGAFGDRAPNAQRMQGLTDLAGPR